MSLILFADYPRIDVYFTAIFRIIPGQGGIARVIADGRGSRVPAYCRFASGVFSSRQMNKRVEGA